MQMALGVAVWLGAAALGLLAPACDGGAASWQQRIEEVPADADEVLAAVASLPECGALLRGGIIRWRPVVHCGTVQPVSGCSYPAADPPLVEVVYRPSAWDGPSHKPLVSTLAHELCHVCGYTDGPDRGELQADACAMRARDAANR